MVALELLIAAPAFSAGLSRDIEATGDPRLDGILSNVTWSADTLTYTFPDHPADDALADFTLQPLDEAQRILVRRTFGEIEELTGFRLIEKNGSTDLTFGRWNHRSILGRVNASVRDKSGELIRIPGQTWISEQDRAWNDLTAGSYATRWFRHELGHILGLEHTHNNFARHPTPFYLDNSSHTLMTYRATAGSPPGGLSALGKVFPTTYMSLDILALQHLYGANWDTNAGDTVYKFSPDTGDYWINDEKQPGNPTGKLFMTLWDGGGMDTLDFSAYDTNGRFDLRPGHFSTPSETQRVDFGNGEKAEGSISMPFLPKGDPRALFENITVGNGDNTIALNYADNHVRLGSGHNRVVVYPGTGSDEIVGFGEDDVLDLCPYHVPAKMVHIENDGADVLVTIDQWPDDQIRVVGLAGPDLDARVECDEQPAGWLTTILSLVFGRH